MKNIKIFAFAAGLLAIAACNKENGFVLPGGYDASKAAVSSLNYDESASTAKAVGFTWDASKALAAGATSFTLELTDNIETSDVENGTSVTIVYAPETSAVVTKDITAGSFYYARIRANYEGFYYSDWTYLGSNSNPLAVLVGTGPVEAKFGAPAGLSFVPAETSFKATWDAVPFATTYTFEYKAQSSGEWSVVGDLKATKYEVEGLVAETSYDVRVKAYKGETASEYTTATVTTLPPSGFKPQMATADAFIEFLTSEAPGAAGTNEYTLEADIDLSGKTVPMAESFKGVLDGKGHTIKGIQSGSPLFATLSGTVKNLVIDASCKFAPAVPYFGIIAGEGTGAIISVHNKAAVTLNAETVADPMLVAALAGQFSGEISDCVNDGAVTVNVSGATVAVGVGGIVGYCAGTVKNCNNQAQVSFTAKNITAKTQVIDAKDALPTIGGIVGYGAPGFNVGGCNNKGKVVYAITAADTDLVANLNRNQIGGIAGSPCGEINSSNNYGEVNVSVKHSTPGTALPKEFIVCVGGIGGGDYQFTNSTDVFSNTSYINCVNEGNVIVDSDASNSNSAIGGIVGWPGQEKPETGTKVSGCTNKGNVTGKGAMKCRLGGIEGGTGVIENCVNEGIITLEATNTGSAIGSICGFHSQGHAITGCTAKGEVNAKVKATGGVGGLIGNIGNVAHETGTGCVVNCKITAVDADAAKTTGFVVGYFNGTSKVIVLGTTDSPIKVSGTLNGNNPSPDNIRGTSNTHANHTINYTIL